MSILYRYATTRRGRCHQCNSLLTDKGFDASSWATGTPCELSGQRGSSLQLQLHKGCRDACSCRSQGAGELDSGPARRQTWHCPDRSQACTATCTCGITKGIIWSPTSPKPNPPKPCDKMSRLHLATIQDSSYRQPRYQSTLLYLYTAKDKTYSLQVLRQGQL